MKARVINSLVLMLAFTFSGASSVGAAEKSPETSSIFAGSGLVKVADSFIYVDENGEFALDEQAALGVLSVEDISAVKRQLVQANTQIAKAEEASSTRRVVYENRIVVYGSPQEKQGGRSGAFQVG